MFIKVIIRAISKLIGLPPILHWASLTILGSFKAHYLLLSHYFLSYLPTSKKVKKKKSISLGILLIKKKCLIFL